jgi:hypothetical protein
MVSSRDARSPYRRPQAAELARRLAEPRRFIQVIAGPRQAGKSTLVAQAVGAVAVPVRFVSADEPTLRGPEWIAAQWEAARLEQGPAGGVLVIDEVQKAAGWSESVKRLWDEDTRAGRALHVVLLGSAPLLVEQGLSESLAGRFEVIRVPHWSLAEMRRPRPRPAPVPSVPTRRRTGPARRRAGSRRPCGTMTDRVEHLRMIGVRGGTPVCPPPRGHRRRPCTCASSRMQAPRRIDLPSRQAAMRLADRVN